MSRILQIAHGHPRSHPGGTELTALALHRQALNEGLDSWYLGALEPGQVLPNQDALMVALTEDHREAALFAGAFRRFALAQDDHHGFLREFSNYLRLLRPDVVHFHHVLNFGLESLFVARTALPEARIVFTLHDYYLICANNGQLYRHETGERCPGPSPSRCAGCVTDYPANDLALRRLGIDNALSVCDALVSPSAFLRDKVAPHLRTGRPIEVIENGYLGVDAAPAPRRAQDGDPVVFGYFGNISAVKGLGDLLEAALLLDARGVTGFRIHVHGSQLFEDAALATRIETARTLLGERIDLLGRYAPEDMPALIGGVDCVVFPSVWWENAPLVIYESLYHGRQVIAYPHGGAPEILDRHHTGLLARRSDPRALADTMAGAIADRSRLDTAQASPVPIRSDLLAAYRRQYRL